MRRVLTAVAIVLALVSGSTLANASEPITPRANSSAPTTGQSPISASKAAGKKTKIPKKKAKRVFKKLLKAARSGSVKKTRKYTANKKQARKAVKYLSYFEGDVISQQRSTSCYVYERQLLCNHYAEQQVSVVDFDIIMTVDAVAKRTRSGRIVFKNFRYANNIS